jgi:chemotaxis protein MotB
MGKRVREEPTGGSWLDTYADMVTLLLTFFVVLLSMSSIDQYKFEALVESFASSSNISESATIPSDSTEPYDGPMTMDSLYEQMKNYIDANMMEAQISISNRDGIIYIRFNSQLLFEPDRYALRGASREVLDFMGMTLKLYEDQIKTINFCGHTANTGRQQSAINDWRLSGERAATVATFFEENFDFSKEKMITFGYGDNYPIASNDNEEGRQRNRRVELVIVGTESGRSFDVYGLLGGTYDSDAFPTSDDGTGSPLQEAPYQGEPAN